MYRVLSIERTCREPSGSYSAGSGGQCPTSQPPEAAGAGSLPLESGRDSGRMGHCCESAQGGGAGAVRHSESGIDAVVSGHSAGCEYSACARDANAGRAGGSRGFLRTLALALISFYRAAISPTLPSSCRFYPSCSIYAYEAVSVWGLRRGLRLAIKRLGRCRPFGPYGFDPVPERDAGPRAFGL